MLDGGTVAVLGLGLIGGSLARDLSARGIVVAGHDVDTATLDAACAATVVQQRLGPSLAGLDEARAVIVAVPVSASPDLLALASPHLRGTTLVMDVGSTKRMVVAAARSAGLADRFVGSHPMAGDHRTGWTAARTGLFSGATVYLCPTSETREGALALARELWAAVGASTQSIDADVHDARVAHTSHLPQVASTAIAVALAKAHLPMSELGPGGRDVLRLAASSPDLWTAIALDNADAIRGALDALGSELAHVRNALASRDESALRAFFARANAWASAPAKRQSAP